MSSIWRRYSGRTLRKKLQVGERLCYPSDFDGLALYRSGWLIALGGGQELDWLPVRLDGVQKG